MSILNNNGVITYEDFVISENEHSDPYEYTSDENSDEDSDSEERESLNEEKKDDSEESDYENRESLNEEKKDDSQDSDYENEEKKDDSEETESLNEIKFIETKNISKQIRKRKPKITNECGICADTLNRSNRKEVKCLFCNYSACRSCIEQYLLQSNESICMNCKAVWNREFLDENLTKVFMKGKYKKRREDILMDKQKALLQATLPIAETRKNAKIRLDEISERQTYLYEQIRVMNEELNRLDTESYRLRNQLTTTKAEDTQKKQFIKKCPNGDCRGFLSTRWKCGLCNINVCSECHEIKETNNNENNENIENPQHVCKPENVETAKLIFKDCKNCPKCGTYIYKIDGCDQLFCTNCHTAFSWKTGQIETGRIHNPHYYEWLKKGGKQQRELLDIPCGGIPQAYNMRTNVEPYIDYIGSYTGYCSPSQQLMQRNYMPSMYNTIRLVTHIQDATLRDFQNDIERIRGKELDLRCEYLMNEIDDEEWKVKLQQNDYKLEYLTDLSQLYQMFSTVSSDIILFIYNTAINNRPRKISSDLIIEKMDEIYELISYFNNHSQKLAKRFGKKRYDCINNFSIEKSNV